MTVGERIKKVREKTGMSQVDFADKINVSKQTLYKYENNLITNIPSDKIEAVAEIGGVSPAFLMGWIDIAEQTRPTAEELQKFKNAVLPIHLKKFRLLGEISCGEPIYANEDRESYIMAGTDIKADFCLKARGNSMINARIYDGDIVFIQQSDKIENGCIYAVGIDDEVLLKRIYYDKENNMFQLVSENPAYPPKVITGENLNHIVILGKAVAFQSDVK